MKMTFDEFLVLLQENLPHVFNTIELVIIALLNRRVGKVAKAQAAAVQPVAEPDPVKEVKTVAVDTSVQKKKLRAEILADLDLFFSDTPDDELTEEQQARVDKLLAYIEGGK